MVCAQAQEPAAKGPVFDVVSIKPRVFDARGNRGINPSPGGRVTITNAPLSMLIGFAYEVRENEVTGGPKWMETESYDIVGKADGPVSSPQQLGLLIRSLLADRFQFRFHYETKEAPVFALTVAKSGLKMQPTRPDSCAPFDFNAPPPASEPGRPRIPRCGSVGIRPATRGAMAMNATGMPMQKTSGSFGGLASVLGDMLGRPVIDKTGLTGIYNVHLEWMPDRPGATDTDDAAPPIFVALREQLGLNVESARGPVQVMVIDRLERPSEN
jgi:uncharacterized protein (TIGR03435 family)